MLSKSFIRKRTTQNFSSEHNKYHKKEKKKETRNNLTLFEPKQRILRYRSDTSEPLDNLSYQVFKVGFKGQSHMFGPSMFSTKK